MEIRLWIHSEFELVVRVHTAMWVGYVTLFMVNNTNNAIFMVLYVWDGDDALWCQHDLSHWTGGRWGGFEAIITAPPPPTLLPLPQEQNHS